MALYAFDGTWNENEAVPEADTNVIKLKDAYQGNVGYISGVGTRFGVLGRALGGVFGAGGQTRIEEMHEKLVGFWREDDDVIDITGFSRGAALAVHFANLIGQEGVVIDGEVVARPRVRFLGVWDIVGSFGIPINFVLNFQETNIGYDLVAPDIADTVCHGMALHERRQTFDLTRLDEANTLDHVEEVWFRGVHSDVGGGNENTALSNIPLQWMMEHAMRAGLPISQTSYDAYDAQDPRAPVSENFDPVENARRPMTPADTIHSSAVGKALEVGEAETFTARAEEKYAWSGIRLKAGGHYAFTIADGDTWKDQDTECGPTGWSSEDLPWLKEQLFEMFEGRRRCPPANWFELIGTIGDDEELMFRIGAGGPEATFTAPVDGELYVFANDLKSTYGNNSGDLAVTVTRVAVPGRTPLRLV